MDTRTDPGLAILGAQGVLTTVDPALIKRGVRIFVFFLVKMLKYYGKYETVVNPVLPSGVGAALGVLIAALAEIELLNRPGPE